MCPENEPVSPEEVNDSSPNEEAPVETTEVPAVTPNEEVVSDENDCNQEPGVEYSPNEKARRDALKK